MKKRIFSAWPVALAFLVALLSVGSLSAQTDPDPNSPSPILLSLTGSDRAMAMDERFAGKVPLARIPARAFQPQSRIVLYARNIRLMEGEGANAFRVWAQDGQGKIFRFPVTDVQEIEGSKRVFAVSVELADQLHFWDSLSADGDVFIYLTWRGMGSNKVRLGIGQMGGLKEASSAQNEGFADVSGASASPKAKIGAPDAAGYKWSNDRIRFLEQATFGPNAVTDEKIRQLGIRTWIADQFDTPYPSATNPYPNQPLKPTNQPPDCDNEQTTTPDVPTTCFRDTYTMYQPQTWFMREALYGDAQLRHRVAWALAQIWVTSGVDVQQGRHIVEYHKILSNNAFGNYRTLMGQMTRNPAMGTYLDMAISTRNNPNENYAREIMQLFTIGLFMLNPDGTLQLDSTGNPIPTYDQNGVNNLTKVLTGWSFCNTASACPNLALGTVNYIDPMIVPNSNNHDITGKTLLTYPGSTTSNIAPCTGCTAPTIATYALNSMDQALNNIFNHPNVGPFVSKILIQHMVTSEPTPAYVGRVATAFNDNGLGVRGDMKAVIRAILLDPEARGDLKTDPNFGKLREPVQLTTNLFRAFNVRSANGTALSDGYLTGRVEFVGMAQVPFASPTVFNYYPPDYGIPGTSLLGPEFAIMTTSTSVQRANFIDRMIFNTIPVSNPTAPNGTSLNFSDMQALAAADTTGNSLVDELNRRMLHGTMTPAMKSTILTAVTNIAATNPLQRAKQAMYLVATSSQYQVQR